MNKDRNLFTYILIFFGFMLGFVLFQVDRWQDIHNYSFLVSWSVVILVYMVAGGVIGNLLKRIVHEHTKREGAKKEQDKRLHDLLDSLPGLVIVIEENHKVRFANRNYIMEYGECEGKLCYEASGKKGICDNCSTENGFNNDLPFKSEDLVLNNRTYQVILQPFSDADGTKLVIKTLYDITERKEAEQELLLLQADMARLERLNLVGQMAAGIAHEIRNPMTIVRGYLQLMGTKPEFQSHGSTFELMIEELDRANLIISEFLAFTKNPLTERKYQNINKILRRLYPLLEADALTQNKFIVFEEGDTPDILLNSNEISQLVLNLCRNGLEAMQADGTLTIHTYIEDKHVVFSVEDEGCGIKPEHLDKLGTPFFTTKEDGTGLGLATCYSIAGRHNATINIKSGSGGTIFFVRF